MGSQSGKEMWRETAQNLFTVEVSTVIKHGMTARKMPPPPIALLEIVGKYYWFLHDVQGDLADVEEAIRRKHPQEFDAFLQLDRPANRTNAPSSFVTLRQTAELFIQVFSTPREYGAPSDRIDREKRTILERIYRISSVLEKIADAIEKDPRNAELGKGESQDVFNGDRGSLMRDFDQTHQVRVDPEQLAYIRKAWDLGVEVVVMQSVVQMDGDVITCIHPQYAGQDFQALHRLHTNATKIAIQTWIDLARLVTEFLKESFRELMALVHDR